MLIRRLGSCWVMTLETCVGFAAWTNKSMSQKKRQTKKPRSRFKPKAVPKTTKSSSASSQSTLVWLLGSLGRTCLLALGAAITLLGSFSKCRGPPEPSYELKEQNLGTTSGTQATRCARFLQKARTLLVTEGGILANVLPWWHERTSQESLDDSSKPLLGSSQESEDESTDEQRSAADRSRANNQAISQLGLLEESSEGDTYKRVSKQPPSTPSGRTDKERSKSLELEKPSALSRHQAVAAKQNTSKIPKSSNRTEVATKSGHQSSQLLDTKRGQVKKTVHAGGGVQRKKADLAAKVPKTAQSIGKGDVHTGAPNKAQNNESKIVTELNQKAPRFELDSLTAEVSTDNTEPDKSQLPARVKPQRTVVVDSNTKNGTKILDISGNMKEGKQEDRAIKVMEKSGYKSTQLQNTMHAKVKKAVKDIDLEPTNKATNLGDKGRKRLHSIECNDVPTRAHSKAQNIKENIATELNKKAAEIDGLTALVSTENTEPDKSQLPARMEPRRTADMDRNTKNGKGSSNPSGNTETGAQGGRSRAIELTRKSSRKSIQLRNTKRAKVKKGAKAVGQEQTNKETDLGAKVPKSARSVEGVAIPLKVSDKAHNSKRASLPTELTNQAQTVPEDSPRAQVPQENSGPDESYSLAYEEHQGPSKMEINGRDGTEGKTKEGKQPPDATSRKLKLRKSNATTRKPKLRKSKRKGKTKSESDLVSKSHNFSDAEDREAAKQEVEQDQDTAGNKTAGWLPDKFCAYVRLADHNDLPEVLVKAHKVQDSMVEEEEQLRSAKTSFSAQHRLSLISTIKQVVRLCSKMLNMLKVDEAGAKAVEGTQQNHQGGRSNQRNPKSIGNSRQKTLEEFHENNPPPKSSEVPDGTLLADGRSERPLQPSTLPQPRAAENDDHTLFNRKARGANNGSNDSSSAQPVPKQEAAGDISAGKSQDLRRCEGGMVKSGTFSWKVHSPFFGGKSKELENDRKPSGVSTIVSIPNWNWEAVPPTNLGGSGQHLLQHDAKDQGEVSRAKVPQHSAFGANSPERKQVSPKNTSLVGKLDQSRRKLWEKAEAPAGARSKWPPKHWRKQNAKEPEIQAGKQLALSTAGGCCDPHPTDDFWPCQHGCSGKVEGLVRKYESPQQKRRRSSLARH